MWVELSSGPANEVAVTEFRRRITIATLWFVSTLWIAVVSPDIGIVIDVLGSLAAIFIFVFPGEYWHCVLCFNQNKTPVSIKINYLHIFAGVCLLQSTLRSDPSLYLNKHCFLLVAAFAFIIVGTFIFGVVLTQAIERFADISKDAQRLCE